MFNIKVATLFSKEEKCVKVLNAINLDIIVQRKIENNKNLKQEKGFNYVTNAIDTATCHRIVCPRCRKDKIGNLNNDEYPYKCNDCNKRFDERIGAIFQRGLLSSRQYFAIIFLTNIVDDLTAIDLSLMTGVSRQAIGVFLEKLELIRNYHGRKVDKEENEKRKARRSELKMDTAFIKRNNNMLKYIENK